MWFQTTFECIIIKDANKEDKQFSIGSMNAISPAVAAAKMTGEEDLSEPVDTLKS